VLTLPACGIFLDQIAAMFGRKPKKQMREIYFC